MIQTDIDFPPQLPCPLKEGHSVKHVQPFVRTNMESGRARQRRRFTSVPSMQTFKWVFTSLEAQIFEAWFRDALNDGAEWFNFNTFNPLGDTRIVCRFASMYEGPNPFGALQWTVSAELEVWERPLLDDGWGLLPDYLDGAAIFDRALNDVWPET